MRLRTSGAYTIGLAIALALGVATAAGAQADTTKSRVPVKKEQPAPTKSQPGVPVMKETAPEPVAPAPAPPVTRTDTMPRAAAGEVVTPKDTMAATVIPKCSMANCGMMQQPQPRANPTRYLFGTSGFYLGVGAGTATPFNVLHDMGYDTGFDLTIPIGWQRPGRALGVRATLAYDQIHADKATADVTAPAMLGSAPDPKIYSGTIDALLKFPIGNSVRDGRGLSFYAVGGGGAYLFRGFGGTTALSDMLGGDKIGSSGKNVHKWGVQAGAGLEYGLGPTAVFVESRWVNVFTKGSTSGNDYLRWIPISVGVTLR